MQKYTWKMASNSLKNPGILWLRKSGNPVNSCFKLNVLSLFPVSAPYMLCVAVSEANLSNFVRRDVFYLVDYVEKDKHAAGISKKKKKRILPDTTEKLFIFGLIRNHWENNYFETSLSFGKLRKNYNKWGPCLFFFCDRPSEFFQLM